ncbi:indole-3-glycerol-phosphate synthase [Streptomyces sp. NPDC004134]|uniref:indole-3-glycerol-phosphate synthase n=1 Tax=Streptomyces sp. NPDC004134 TaxID=3364691 RepID=UPI00367DCF10
MPFPADITPVNATDQRFGDALAVAELPVIMEIKQSRAGGEDLLQGRTPGDLVRRYEELGAPALSVVTGSWLGGTARLLDEVAAATSLPVLVKDFFTKEKQIRQAAEAGAAAVLLTATILPHRLMAVLIDACLAHAVTPFVEITSGAELSALTRAEACVVAVNNTDIRTREADEPDLGRSHDLLPRVRAAGAGLAVSTGGIATPEEAAGLLAAGFRGLTIGTGLLRAEDLDAWFGGLRALLPGAEPAPADGRRRQAAEPSVRTAPAGRTGRAAASSAPSTGAAAA